MNPHASMEFTIAYLPVAVWNAVYQPSLVLLDVRQQLVVDYQGVLRVEVLL